jgi:hypothetical protein
VGLRDEAVARFELITPCFPGNGLPGSKPILTVLPLLDPQLTLAPPLSHLHPPPYAFPLIALAPCPHRPRSHVEDRAHPAAVAMPPSRSFTLKARFTSRTSVVSSISCPNLPINGPPTGDHSMTLFI